MFFSGELPIWSGPESRVPLPRPTKGQSTGYIIIYRALIMTLDCWLAYMAEDKTELANKFNETQVDKKQLRDCVSVLYNSIFSRNVWVPIRSKGFCSFIDLRAGVYVLRRKLLHPLCIIVVIHLRDIGAILGNGNSSASSPPPPPT